MQLFENPRIHRHNFTLKKKKKKEQSRQGTLIDELKEKSERSECTYHFRFLSGLRCSDKVRVIVARDLIQQSDQSVGRANSIFLGVCRFYEETEKAFLECAFFNFYSSYSN